DPLGLRHLATADLWHVTQDLRVGAQGRGEDVSALTTGARHHQHVLAFGYVLGHGRRALARLVIGMGMHRHESKSLHAPSCSGSCPTMSLTCTNQTAHAHSSTYT